MRPLLLLLALFLTTSAVFASECKEAASFRFAQCEATCTDLLPSYQPKCEKACAKRQDRDQSECLARDMQTQTKKDWAFNGYLPGQNMPSPDTLK